MEKGRWRGIRTGDFSPVRPGRGSKPLYCRTDRETCPSIDPHAVSDAYAELASLLVRSSAERRS
jgi:hypothetical protein